MNKKSRNDIWLAILLCLGMALLVTYQQIQAKALPPETPGVADGAWVWDNTAVTGVTGPVDLISASKPEWREVMSWEAITLSGAAKLCHPFRGGQQGWVGDIRIFTGRSWEPITTTMQWVPDVEGTYMACAQTPSAGTYALFGGYVKPASQGLPECDFPVDLTFHQVEDAAPPAMPAGPTAFRLVAVVVDEDHQPAVGTLAKYSLSKITPAGSVTGAMQGTTTFQMYPEYHPIYPLAIFDEIVYFDIGQEFDFTLTFTSMGCYVRRQAGGDS